MGTIRVEFVPIAKYNLGLFGFDHMQLVFEDETDFLDTQDYWYVMEGIQDGTLFGATLGVLGESGNLLLSSANGASSEDLVAKIGTPETRGSRIVAVGGDAFATWQSMAAYAADINDQHYPYVAVSWPFSPAPTVNSTSFVTTLLWSVGLDINDLMPFGISLSPGTATLLGTSGNDTMSTGGSYSQILTGLGDDTLHGSNNLILFDKLYGGAGNDTFIWSSGENIIHGGQPQLAYAEDGTDTIDYSGVGTVHIISAQYAVEHKVPDYIATFEQGSDQLFSIEQVTWDKQNDTVTAGEGVELLERPLKADLKGQTGGGRGDELSFADAHVPLIINAVDDTTISIQTIAKSGLDAGYWAQSVEWIAGSSADDLIYTGPTLIGAEGGDGDDLIDGRLSAAFTGQSPEGYDVELDGGKGDDTLISGAGRSLARGGDGADRFVLGAMTSADSDGQVEFVIEDADSNDRLYVPYNFFKAERGDFDGSELFQLAGAPFKIDDVNTPSFFDWGAVGDDQTTGNIEFVGLVYYEMDGSDLVITLLQGHREDFVFQPSPEEPAVHQILNAAETLTETKIRVEGWSDGDLGISFPLTWNFETFAEAGSLTDYPGWQNAVDSATGQNLFEAPLDQRPDAFIPADLRDTAASIAFATLAEDADTTPTDGDDVLVIPLLGSHRIDGLAGNDDITGTDGGDVIDGGQGADIMRGGNGNDTYYVDDPDDQVIEGERGSFDTVYASIDYTLPDNVENVTLTGTAIHAIGNALRNTVVGNAADNVLEGGAGDDTLAGNEGTDILIGGPGSDGYVYGRGDGHDIVVEAAGTGSDQDVLVLSGYAPVDVLLVRNPATANDLTVRFTDGGEITIKDYFTGSGAGIERVEFVGGPTWDAAEFASRAAAATVTDNAPPIAVDDFYAYAGSGAFTISALALTENDSDPDGDHLTVISVASPSQGGVALAANGDIVVTPAGDPSKMISFTYVVSDGRGGVASAVATLALVENHVPVITAATLSSLDPATRTALGHIGAEDADGDALTYALESGAGPTKGNVTFGIGGDFTYSASPNASGTDTFTIIVSDGWGGTARHTFTEAIPSVVVPPVDTTPHPHGCVGTNRDDTLSGISGVDIFYGKKGNDIIKTYGGDDIFIVHGDTGLDRIFGGDGYDTIRGGKGNDTIRVTNHLANLNSVEAIEGRCGSDRILATSGNDVLDFSNIKLTSIERIDLGGGNDIVTGSAGTDRFAGGAGHDTFVFAKGCGRDVILDFETGNGRTSSGDVIDLPHAGFKNQADLWKHISQSGADALISIDAKNSILLKDVDAHHLYADNFKIL